MIGNIKINGEAELGMCDIVCVCSYCNNHDKTNASLEFNFREQKIFYQCSKCKKQNVIVFGHPQSLTAPLPRTKLV